MNRVILIGGWDPNYSTKSVIILSIIQKSPHSVLVCIIHVTSNTIKRKGELNVFDQYDRNMMFAFIYWVLRLEELNERDAFFFLENCQLFPLETLIPSKITLFVRWKLRIVFLLNFYWEGRTLRTFQTSLVLWRNKFLGA